MATISTSVSETLGALHQIAPAGYALGVHVEYTTPKFVFQTYPKAWLDYYSSNGLIMRDPMVAWGFENTGFARWSTLDDAAGVLKLAGEYGMTFGAVTAVTSEDSRSIGGFAHPDREFTEDEMQTLLNGVQALHDATADAAELDEDTIQHLKKMSVMVTHPGS